MTDYLLILSMVAIAIIWFLLRYEYNNYRRRKNR